MKKTYMTPQMEVYSFKPTNAIMTTSVLTPEDWGGGQGAGARPFEDNALEDFFLGGGNPADLQKMFMP